MPLEGVDLIAALQKVSTPEGIQVLEPLSVNGATQWLSIRGLDKRNPVILFIHGGPGSPTLPTSWAFQRPWEDFFTVVQWNQRCTGKNWSEKEAPRLAKSITLEQLVLDALEVMAHLRKRLGKEKIVIMGWSFGTRIATELAARRPEWISAYVGVGQLTRRADSEEYIYKQALRIARQRNHSQAIRELQELQPYPDRERRNDTEKMLVLRKWVRAFNGGWYGIPDLELYYHLQNLSPECRDEDAETLRSSTRWFIERLADNDGSHPEVTGVQSDPRVFQVPVVIIMGRYDLQTPYMKASSYFDEIEAPWKRFITLPRAGHFPMFEQPGRFLKALLEEVLPLTEGTVEPDELADAPH
jgi:proline iminopeptidase